MKTLGMELDVRQRAYTAVSTSAAVSVDCIAFLLRYSGVLANEPVLNTALGFHRARLVTAMLEKFKQEREWREIMHRPWEAPDARD